jgi:F0F1-type ATP synthase membrane subunit b/b'
MNATANQIIAMCFPLLTAAVVWLVALFVRWRWGRSRSAVHEAEVDIASNSKVSVKGEIQQALGQAERLIHQVQRQLERASLP